jgi:Spy/CpxP family protein refolding chaperone
MKRKILAYLGLLITVAAVSAGTSYWVSRKSAQKAGGPATWLHEAELSSDQLQKLEPHEAALKRDLDSLQIVLAKERLSICDLIRSDNHDPVELQQHVTRVAQLEAAQQEVVVRHLMTVSQVLTPEQKDKFFDTMMRDICVGCRQMSCKPGTPCMCGHCDMAHKEKA